MVFDHAPEHPSQWAAIRSVGEKLGIRTESLRRWVRQAERDVGTRPGLTTTEREELKRLQREVVELKRANEILKKAAAFFAQASSTAERSDGRVHRSASRYLWSRADLCGAADRPSTYFLRKAQQDDATTRSPRARQDDERRPAIQRVWDENDQVYGPRKVWRQLRREGVRVARCTVERLMRAMGLRGVARGRAWKIAPASCRERDRRSPSRPGRSGLRCDTARALRRRDRGLYPSSAILSAFCLSP